MEEKKLADLLSIEQSNHTPAQRTSMIIQGVNWLTLIQEVLILFIYRVPAALLSTLQTLSQNQPNKDSK